MQQYSAEFIKKTKALIGNSYVLEALDYMIIEVPDYEPMKMSLIALRSQWEETIAKERLGYGNYSQDRSRITLAALGYLNELQLGRERHLASAIPSQNQPMVQVKPKVPARKPSRKRKPVTTSPAKPTAIRSFWESYRHFAVWAVGLILLSVVIILYNGSSSDSFSLGMISSPSKPNQVKKIQDVILLDEFDSFEHADITRNNSKHYKLSVLKIENSAKQWKLVLITNLAISKQLSDLKTKWPLARQIDYSKECADFEYREATRYYFCPN